MEQTIRRKAEERVERRIEFFTHLVTYFIVNAVAVFVWYFFLSDRGKGFPWFILLLIPWGIGLLAHFIGVFLFDRVREKMIDKEVNRIQQRSK